MRCNSLPLTQELTLEQKLVHALASPVDATARMLSIMQILQGRMTNERFAEFITQNGELVNADTVWRWKANGRHNRVISVPMLSRIFDAIKLEMRSSISDLTRIHIFNLSHHLTGEKREMFVKRISEVRLYHEGDGRIDVGPFSYSTSAPSRRKELEIFTSLSDNDEGIIKTHPELIGGVRTDLYQSWMQSNKKSFLVLEREDRKASKFVDVAVSIVLPLTSTGTAGIVSRRFDAVEMPLDCIAKKEDIDSILIDTWIKNKSAFVNTKSDVYLPQRDVCIMALLYHISLFWNSARPAKILVEPATNGMRGLCREIGFEAVDSKEKCFFIDTSKHHILGNAATKLSNRIQSFSVQGATNKQLQIGLP